MRRADGGPRRSTAERLGVGLPAMRAQLSLGVPLPELEAGTAAFVPQSVNDETPNGAGLSIFPEGPAAYAEVRIAQDLYP